jgi:beta-N-acetylhexosaminidase
VARKVGTKEHLRQAQAVTDRTVTALRNPGGALPAQVDGTSVLVAGAGPAATAALAASLGDRGATTTVVDTGTAPTAAQRAAATTAAAANDLTVVLTNKAWSSPAQQQLVSDLEATGKPVVVVAVRDPYDVAYVPDTLAFLATYSATAVSMEAVAKVLTGEVPPAGRLPVDVPVAGAPDQVLMPFGHGLTW